MFEDAKDSSWKKDNNTYSWEREFLSAIKIIEYHKVVDCCRNLHSIGNSTGESMVHSLCSCSSFSTPSVNQSLIKRECGAFKLIFLDVNIDFSK